MLKWLVWSKIFFLLYPSHWTLELFQFPACFQEAFILNKVSLCSPAIWLWALQHFPPNPLLMQAQNKGVSSSSREVVAGFFTPGCQNCHSSSQETAQLHILTCWTLAEVFGLQVLLQEELSGKIKIYLQTWSQKSKFSLLKTQHFCYYTRKVKPALVKYVQVEVPTVHSSPLF